MTATSIALATKRKIRLLNLEAGALVHLLGHKCNEMPPHSSKRTGV